MKTAKELYELIIEYLLDFILDTKIGHLILLMSISVVFFYILLLFGSNVNSLYFHITFIAAIFNVLDDNKKII